MGSERWDWEGIGEGGEGMRIIEGEYDDRPLPGPWNRRRREYPAPGSESSGDDLPLRGPWNRRQEPVPAPVEVEPERSVPRPGEEKEYTPGIPVERTITVSGRAATAGEKVKNGDRGDAVRDGAEIPVPEGRCPAHGERRACMHRLFSPSGLYAGIVMAEILGGRGGRVSRRSSAAGRWGILY
ncbi:MAG: hypothetical protein ACOY40_00105 [Bacillota bacterium]